MKLPEMKTVTPDVKKQFLHGINGRLDIVDKRLVTLKIQQQLLSKNTQRKRQKKKQLHGSEVWDDFEQSVCVMEAQGGKQWIVEKASENFPNLI